MACQPASHQEETAIIQKIRTLGADQILVCAHRAYHKKAPENSLASIKASLALGVDIIEIDVRTTKDDSLVLMHDATIDRTTNGTGAVKELSYTDLLQLSLYFHDSLTLEKIPTLHQVLDMCKGKDLILNLDLKAVNYQKLYSKLETFDMQHQVISFIGSEEDVRRMKNIDPEYAILPLAAEPEEVGHYASLIQSRLIHLKEETFTRDIMDQARSNNQITFINSLKAIDKAFMNGDITAIDRMIALKPAIIQTDYPAALINYLRERNLHQ